MKNSKIVLGNGTVLMDLTADTVKDNKLLKGYTAHGADGEPITGTCTYDVDSAGATATEDEILAGKTAGVRGAMVTGKMPNKGAVTIEVSDVNGNYPIPYGLHDGSGMVVIAASELAKFKSENIREGVTLMGIPGGMTGSEGVAPESRDVTPTFERQVILPGAGFTHLSQVTVAAIPVSVTDNSSGGQTVTIG